jgi:hypothetical protein
MGGYFDFLSMAMGWPAAAEEQAPDTEGLQFTMPDSRLHFAFDTGRPHYVMPEGKLHYAITPHS